MSFEKEVKERVDAIGQNEELKSSAHNFLKASLKPKYSTTFPGWAGRLFNIPRT